jgi:hypothetical protein
LYDTSRTTEQLLTLLAETPQQIAGLTADRPGALLHTAPSPGEWSVNDVLAHLRSCADVWGSYMAQILDEDMPTIRAVNPTTWIKKTDYPEQNFQPSFQVFVTQRVALLALLEPLAAEDWSRAATVTGSGKPRIRTLHAYGEWLVNHERTHLRQIKRLMNSLDGSTKT